MNNRWLMSKIGFFDFWYYDNQEFFFEDGRMLLRGSNGSGKSVTMQSFIPLILDGNTSPERIDPFGTKARKIDSYLIEDDDERSERIGYLFMELKRENSNTYFSMGIGIRAMKGKSPEKWYFYINDNRRINEDLFLYNNKSVGKVSLSKRKLENRIADGGRVFSNQSEYVNAINEHIFGFENCEHYKELLDLLIKLRTPKLSKDFKPTDLNETLSESLKALGENDLRAMSDAIEEIDNISNKLDELKRAEHSAKKITAVYEEYNHKVLAYKAKQLLEVFYNFERLNNEKNSKKAQLDTNTNKLNELNSKIEELNIEAAGIKQRIDLFNDSDFIKLKNSYDELIKRQNEDKAELNKKEESKQEHEKAEIKYRYTLRSEKEKLEEKEVELFKLIDEIAEYAVDCNFEEHKNFDREIRNELNKSYNFDYIISLSKALRDNFKTTLNEFNEYNKTREIYEEENLKHINKEKERKNTQIEADKINFQINNEKNAVIDRINVWNENNKQLKVLGGDLSNLIVLVSDFSGFESENLIKRSLFDLKIKREEQIRECINNNKTQLHNYSEKRSVIDEELKSVLMQEEIIPERSDAVKLSRERLIENNIEFKPFYEAVDFISQIDEAKADSIEEALFNMGIIDAVVVEEKYRDFIFNNKKLFNDKFIFVNSSSYKNEFSWLYSDSINIGEYIKEEKNNFAYINDDGIYGIAFLEGIVSGEYKSKFIGAEKRRRAREEKILSLKNEIAALDEKIAYVENTILNLEAEIKVLNQEEKAFPDMSELYRLINDKTNIENQLSLINAEIEKINLRLKEISDILVKNKLSLEEKCKAINVEFNYDKVKSGFDGIAYYFEEIKNVKSIHCQYIYQLELCSKTQELIDTENNQLDNIRYEINKLSTNLKETAVKIAEYEAQFEKSENKAELDEIDKCKKRQEDINSEILSAKEAIGGLCQSIKNDKSEYSKLEASLEKEDRKIGYYHGVLCEEIKLNLTEYNYDENENETLFQLAKRIYLDIKNKFNAINDLYEVANRLVMCLNTGDVLAEYNLKVINLFQDINIINESDCIKRIDIRGKYQNRVVNVKALYQNIVENIRLQESLLSERDKILFEDILINNVSKKIIEKIETAKAWIEKINQCIKEMDTSSGLSLSIKWVAKKSENDSQINISELTELLMKNTAVLKDTDIERIKEHFKDKLKYARNLINDSSNIKSYMGAMKEVLDYRKWYEFQIYYNKPGEKRKPLTNNEFFKFSGGEKAMSMYVPLFAAVSAKYSACNCDAPQIIALDEAFAGVDDRNIRNMFKLINDFKFQFIINSQSLWGDCDTLPKLSIYQLFRPNNAKYVSVMQYIWNGYRRDLKNE